MRLVPVTRERIEALREIRNSCASYMTGNDQQITPGEQAAWWADVDGRPDLRVWLFEESDGVAIGYGIARRMRRRWWLTGGLLPARRGRGYGRRLFEELIDAVRPEDAWLDVRADNVRARRLYERLGFAYTKKGANLCTMVRRVA